MKRFVNLFAFVAVATATLFVGCAEKEEKAEAINSDFVIYLDAKQVLQKSGLLDELAPMRELVAEAVAWEFEEGDQEFVASIVKNLDNTGISFSKPFYVGADLGEYGEPCNVALVLGVNNVKNVDRLLDMAGLEFEVDGSNRYILLDAPDMMVGYNSKRFVVAVGDEYNSADEVLAAKLAAPTENLSIFGSRDVAFYAKTEALLAIADESDDDDDYYEDYYDYDDYYEDELDFDVLEEYRNKVTADDYVIAGLAFEKGRIVLDASLEENPYDGSMAKIVNNENLAYLPGKTLAVLNVGVNGKAMAAVLEEYANLAMEMMEDEVPSEIGMIVGVVVDVLKEFNGDLTLALNDYSQNYYSETLDAVAMMQLNDGYDLISTLSSLASLSGLDLEKVKKDMYAVDVDDQTGYVGQTDNVFYVGLNDTPAKSSNSAAKSRWVADVTNSYGYLVVDAQNIIKKYRRSLENELDYEAMEIINGMDYLYMSIPSTSSMEIALVLKDKDVNPLELIATYVMDNFGDELMSASDDLLLGFGDDDYEDDYYGYYTDDDDYYDYFDEDDYYEEEVYVDTRNVRKGKALVDEMMDALLMFDEEEVGRIALEMEELEESLSEAELATLDAYAEEVVENMGF